MGDRIKNLFVKNWHIVFAISVILTITIGRIAYSLKSGFLTPDEAFYYQYIVYYKAIFFFYMWAVKTLFCVNNIYQAFIVLPLTTSLFSICSIVLIDKILMKIKAKDCARKAVVVSFCFAVTFILYAPFWGVEPLALFFSLCGIYWLIDSIEDNKKVILSVVMFAFAYMCRIEFSFFTFFNTAVLFVYLLKHKVSWMHFIPFFVSSLLIVNVKNLIVPWTSVVLFQIASFFFHQNVNNPVVQTDVQTPTLVPVPVSYNPVVTDLSVRLVNSINVFGRGLAFGLNPIFLAMIFIGLFLTFKNFQKYSMKEKLLYGNCLTSLLAFVAISFFMSSFQLASIHLMTSTMMRYAYVSLISLLLLNKVYCRLKPKQIMGIFLSIVIIGIIFFQPLSLGLQSNLSVTSMNRISFDYKSPWMRLAEYTKDSGKTLIIAEPVIRMQLFQSENVTIYSWLVGNETIKKGLNDSSWDTILFYGELHYAHEITLEKEYAWLGEIIKTIPKEVIWEDGESYLYKVAGE